MSVNESQIISSAYLASVIEQVTSATTSVGTMIPVPQGMPVYMMAL